MKLRRRFPLGVAHDIFHLPMGFSKAQPDQTRILAETSPHRPLPADDVVRSTKTGFGRNIWRWVRTQRCTNVSQTSGVGEHPEASQLDNSVDFCDVQWGTRLASIAQVSILMVFCAWMVW